MSLEYVDSTKPRSILNFLVQMAGVQPNAQAKLKQLAKAGAAAVVTIGILSGLIAIVQFVFEFPAPLKLPFYLSSALLILIAVVVVVLYVLEVNKTVLTIIAASSCGLVLVFWGATTAVTYFSTPSVYWYGPVTRPTPIPEFLEPIRAMIDGETSLGDLVDDEAMRDAIRNDRSANGYEDARYVIFYSSPIKKLPKSISIRDMRSAKIGVCVLDTNVGDQSVVPLTVNTTVDLAKVSPIVGSGRLVVLIFPVHLDEANKLREIVDAGSVQSQDGLGSEVALDSILHIIW